MSNTNPLSENASGPADFLVADFKISRRTPTYGEESASNPSSCNLFIVVNSGLC